MDQDHNMLGEKSLISRIQMLCSEKGVFWYQQQKFNFKKSKNSLSNFLDSDLHFRFERFQISDFEKDVGGYLCSLTTRQHQAH